jgi:hypothetical protein
MSRRCLPAPPPPRSVDKNPKIDLNLQLNIILILVNDN